MTDSLAQVPAQYRDQVTRKRLQAPANTDADHITPMDVFSEVQKGGIRGRRHEIPYQAFEGSARRIIIPVTFNDSVTANLLLDTGSPGLLISPKLAGRLGLVNEQVEQNLLIKTGGIGGTAPAMLNVVDSVRVGNAAAQFLPATITEVPSEEFEGLVGMDFMGNYRISIDTARDVLIFEELPPRSDRPGGYDETWWRSNFQRFSDLRDAWSDYLRQLENTDLAASEKEKRVGIARNQYNEADQLYRKLERFARDNTVPSNWRR